MARQKVDSGTYSVKVEYYLLLLLFVKLLLQNSSIFDSTIVPETHLRGIAVRDTVGRNDGC